MVEKFQRQNSLKSQFFKETSCSICSITFGVVDCTYIKKYCCKICYKAICSNCSSTPIESSPNKNLDLVCKLCGDTSDSTHQNNAEISEAYFKCVDIIREIQNTQQKIDKNKKKIQDFQKLLHDQESQDLNLTLLSKKEELLTKSHSLKAQINAICQDIEDKETIYFESETYLVDEKNRLEQSKKKSVELYKTLMLKQDENTDLSKVLDNLEMPNKSKKKPDDQISRERKLRKAYEVLVENEKFILDKNNQLEEELKNLEKKMQEKDEELGKIEEGFESIEMEENYLEQLNETLEEQQTLIAKLKEELKANKIEAEGVKKGGGCLIA